MDTAMRKGHPIVFGALIVIAIIEMCIAAWITAKYNDNQNFPSSDFQARVRFVLFASVWTIVLGSMYMASFITMTESKISSIASHFVFLFLTWIFWLAAATALIHSLGGVLNCDTQDKFVYCGHLNALEGFAWLILVILTLMLLFVVIRGIIGARRGNTITAPMVEV